MNSGKERLIGIAIVAAGLIILLGKLGVFAFLGQAFWPLLILAPGIVLHILYMSRLLPAYTLIPAGILTVYGVLFFLCNTWGWGLMTYLWPFLLLGVAVGLLEYAVSEVQRPRLAFALGIWSGALSIIFLIFTLLQTSISYILAVLLIAGGLWLILRRGGKRIW